MLRIEKLARHHDIAKFDCGIDTLNRYLRHYASQNQKAGSAQSYVGLSGDTVIGYFTLVVGHAEYDGAPDRLRKGLARHPVPLMLLARLAVHTDWQGKGVGRGLLRDATLRTLQAADIAGIRAFVVHAKDEVAREFYQRFGFERGFADEFHLFMLINDIRRSVAAG
jgi:GNAT superfamily N-acetyltransferase